VQSYKIAFFREKSANNIFSVLNQALFSTRELELDLIIKGKNLRSREDGFERGQ
jgi:hypothetical protein